MDSLLLVIIFSGLCMASAALGMSVFILAASIQSTRISRTEG